MLNPAAEPVAIKLVTLKIRKDIIPTKMYYKKKIRTLLIPRIKI